MSSLLVFTRDLRLDDNPALCAAAADGPMHCLFVKDEAILNSPTTSQRRQAFLDQCLDDVSRSLAERGAKLNLVYGDWFETVQRSIRDLKVDSVHVADDYSQYAQTRLQRLQDWCNDVGVSFHRHPGITVVPPGHLQPSGGGEYKVFTPYWRSWLKSSKRDIVTPPRSFNDLGLSSPPAESNLYPELSSEIIGGETHGWLRLHDWLQNGINSYEKDRDTPSVEGTSLLSPYLRFGCISPLRLVELCTHLPDSEPFVRQVVWRDFYAQILAARPDCSRSDYRDRGDIWNYDQNSFQSWVDGLTGFPLVDAGMRQLRSQGLMHNRVRMVTASFLIKDLHQDWRLGANYFMSQLLDGDVASNYLNWQWVAGTGTDSNPHRILNPSTQAKRFDGHAEYIRQWIPELSSLDKADALDPSPLLRETVGYPLPIVDHHESVELFKERRLTSVD